jgi:hypothetical protein
MHITDLSGRCQTKSRRSMSHFLVSAFVEVISRLRSKRSNVMSCMGSVAKRGAERSDFMCPNHRSVS